MIVDAVVIGIGASLTIGLPVVLVGFSVKLMHLWK